ncbi:MAG TPA: hypothetical protein VH796_01840 [Nitrososphaeraceae archaeon]
MLPKTLDKKLTWRYLDLLVIPLQELKQICCPNHTRWLRYQDVIVEKIVVQVRSRQFHLRDIRDFRDVVTTKKAAWVFYNIGTSDR